MDSILITGADGFIGSHLTEFLLEKNVNVFAIDIPSTQFSRLSDYLEVSNGKESYLLSFAEQRIQVPSSNENLKLLKCDITNKSLLEKIILESQPKYIFHFAAQPLVKTSWEKPRLTVEINVIGTINIFEILKNHKIPSKVILACTATEFGTTAFEIKRPLKEEDPLKAVHPYGISKIAAELLARQYSINFGIDAVNVRFFNQIGPKQRGVAAADFISQVAQIELGLKEPEIKVGNLEPYRDFTGIKDTIQALWLAAEKGKSGETYNVCSGRKTKIKELLDISLSFSSRKIKVIESVPDKMRSTDENVIIGDNSKIKNELGFEPKQSIKDVLKDIYEYWISYYKKELNA